MAADPDLIRVWSEAWAISRGVAPPAPSHGGFFIQVGQPEQRSRYVFPSLDPPILAALAETISDPWVFLKVCAPSAVVAPVLPRKWVAESFRSMMTADLSNNQPSTARLADDYTIALTREDAVDVASIVDASGEIVARGRLIARGGVAIFDRISTAEAHRRRGLGRVIVEALSAEAMRQGATQGILAATHIGRELYAALGWRFYSAYSSFVIPGESSAAPAS